MSRGTGAGLLLLGAVLAASGGRARAAEELRAVTPGAPLALGRVLEAGPGPRALWLLGAAGYGYTEAVLGVGDRHDRWSGRLAVDARLLEWLALTLRLDGRYDRHVLPGQPLDTGYVGDPRLEARVDKALTRGWRLAGRAGLWLPGANAPSVELDAITPEVTAALTYAAARVPLSTSLNVGYRLDRSHHAAANAATLSASDRLALGLNAFDAVLLGASVRVGEGRLQGFVEGHADLLVGAGAPPPTGSPIFLGAGARVAVNASLRLEAGLEVSPSERPSLAVAEPLVAVPPRFAGWLALAYRFDVGTPPPRQEPPMAPPPAAPPPAPSAVQAIQTAAAEGPAATGSGQLRVLVRSFRGSNVAAEIELHRVGAPADDVKLLRSAGTRAKLDVAPGTYDVHITAAGYEPQHRRVQIEDNGVTLLNVELTRAR